MPICNPALDPIIGGCGSNPDGGVSIAVLMANLYRATLVVGGLALLLYLAWGGIGWITAGGDKGKVEEAQHKITNAVMGMAFLVAVIAIVSLLQWALGINLLNPSLNFTNTAP